MNDNIIFVSESAIIMKRAMTNDDPAEMHAIIDYAYIRKQRKHNLTQIIGQHHNKIVVQIAITPKNIVTIIDDYSPDWLLQFATAIKQIKLENNNE